MDVISYEIFFPLNHKSAYNEISQPILCTNVVIHSGSYLEEMRFTVSVLKEESLSNARSF
jgi:hypothetical protein